MLNKIVDKLKQLSRNPVSVDIERFNDPLAAQTAWTPLKSGGSNFRTHKLVMISTNRVEFRPTVFAYVFCSIFMLVGLGVMGGGFYMLYEQGFEWEVHNVFMIIFGGVFALVGFVLMVFMGSPAVFDTMYGYFWKGRKKADFGIGHTYPDKFTELNQIHALQIIAEHVRSSKSSYYSYELNLVLKDGSRKNVVDHGNIKRLREDALTLSQFLGRPVWDGVAR